jgi:hypothetical protein
MTRTKAIGGNLMICKHCGYELHEEILPGETKITLVDSCGNDGCYVSEADHEPA